MDRTPPVRVCRQLAAEVGHGCPAPDCGSPYLTWHHFDPPWSIHNHHNPTGMIALCRQHHDAADAGAYTPEQLHEFKRLGRDGTAALSGRFEWMRERLIAVVGGSVYYQTPIPVQIGNRPIIWFNRRETGELLLNLDMPTTSGEPRIKMLDNFWVEASDDAQIECPPSGQFVRARYSNGDDLQVRFREIASLAELDSRYRAPLPRDIQRLMEARGISHADVPNSYADQVERSGITFPIAAVEITMKVAGSRLALNPKRTTIEGSTIVGGCWFSGSPVGIHMDALPV